MRDTAYWPDKNDPLGRVHGREKFGRLERKYFVAVALLAKARGAPEFKQVEQNGQLAFVEWDEFVEQIGADMADLIRTLGKKN